MSLGSRIHAREGASAMWLMALLATLVGVGSGLLAVLLRGGVHGLFDLLQGLRGSWMGVLLPAFGALLGVWSIRLLFREPGGHGIPAILESISRHGGALRRRSIFSRMLGSLFTVASGGSAGLEGPIAFSAAAFGSSLASPFRLAERQRILLLGCGAAGGIAAIFNAPLTGLIFAVEVVLAEWTLSTVVPLAISATAATEIARLMNGSDGAFHAAALQWSSRDLGSCIPLGILAGLLAILLVKHVFAVEAFARRLKEKPFLRRTGVVAGLAGLLVGMVGLLVPGAIGEGYELVTRLLEGGEGVALPLLLLLLVGKFLTTAATLGSNAPGGIFAPSLVLGAVLGSSYGHGLSALFPGAHFAPPAFYALVAMAGLVAGAMQAPFTGLFLALETTGGWQHTLPLILVATLSALVSRTLLKHSFYTWEVAERGHLLRPGTDRRILAEMSVGEMLDEESVSIPLGSTLDDLAAMLPRTHRNHFAVVDEGGRLCGMLDLSDLRPFIFDEALRRVTPVETVMSNPEPLPEDQPLLEAMVVIESSGAWVLPVVDREGRFLGTVSKSTLFDRYRRELMVQTVERTE